MDCYSKLPEISLLPSKTASSVVVHLKTIHFGRLGVPDELVADNMSFPNHERQNFASSWGFNMTTSSPCYSQSDGMSEKKYWNYQAALGPLFFAMALQTTHPVICVRTKRKLNHLLINHASTVSFWCSFLVWWNTKTNENLVLNSSHILYGWHERTRHWRILNYCLLIAKYYIFCTSLSGDNLVFQNFPLIMHEKLEALKEIAIANKALPKFYRTWAVLL